MPITVKVPPGTSNPGSFFSVKYCTWKKSPMNNGIAAPKNRQSIEKVVREDNNPSTPTKIKKTATAIENTFFHLPHTLANRRYLYRVLL